MFIDRARIHIKAGDGGNGFVGFRREKYVPAGGPAGGDGGNGGDVIILVAPNLSTLIDFQYKKHYKAANGEHGRNKKQYGKDAEDLIIKVPPGTIIKHGETGETIADLVRVGQKLIVAEGGRGGRGNTHFTSATRQAPAFAEKGDKGSELWIDLELKLIADAGLVGYPNVGKSTFISIVSAAKPKIANYPFTTLVPNLGVVSLDDDKSFVLADIPGLIEGAHQGVGLGTEFLRHIERTKIIIHVVDVSGIDGRDPVDDYFKINNELYQFNKRLSELPQLILANKMDLPMAEENLTRLIEVSEKDGRSVYPISAATGQGTKPVLREISNLLESFKGADIDDEDIKEEVVVYRPQSKHRAPVDQFEIVQEEDGYVVVGEGLERFMARLDLENEETIEYLQRLFERIGLYSMLREMGVADGTVVHVGELEFEYQD